MLLSLSWRFVFISNMKAASTTVEHSLSDFAELQRIFPRNSKHFSLGQIRAAFDGVFETPGFEPERFLTFGVIREPRAWLCSWFNYRSRAELADPRHGQHDQYVGEMSFGRFASEVVLKRPKPFGYVRRQSDILADEGVPGCDYIVRFEAFDEDMAGLVRVLGLPAPWPELRKERNRTSHVRIRPDDIDWDAYPELMAFLEPDLELRRRYLERWPTQLDQARSRRHDFHPPDGIRSSAPVIERMLERHWESYAVSQLYGPTLGVTPEQAEADVTSRGIGAFLPLGSGT